MTFTSSDATSGIRNVRLLVDGVEVGVQNSATGTFTWNSGAAADGSHTLRLTATDNAGNTASTDATYILDRVVPETTLTLNPPTPDGLRGWYAANPSGTLSGAGNVASRWVKIGGGAWTQVNGLFPINGGGEVTVSYYSISVSGVQGPIGETKIKVDSTVPPTPVLLDDGALTVSRTALGVSLGGPIDPESGQYRIHYTVGNAPNDASYRAETVITTPARSFTIDDLALPTGVPVYVSVVVENEAGLVSEVASTDGIVVDPIALAFAVNSSAVGGAGGLSYAADAAIEGTFGIPFAERSLTDNLDGAMDGGFWSAFQLQYAKAFVVLSGFTANPATVPLRVEITRPGTSKIVQSWLINPTTQGALAISPEFIGIYDVTVKGSHWLKQRLSKVSFPLTTRRPISFTLMNGDVNGDNRVDRLDQAALVKALGTHAGDLLWNPNADLNGDGQVSSLDADLLRKTMGRVGDP